MPTIDAKQAYDDLFQSKQTNSLGQDSKKLRSALTDWKTDLERTAKEQHGCYEDEVIKQDAAMWYGAITKSSGESQAVLRRLFAVLYFGQLYVYRNGNYQRWSAPIATALSHGGRIIIQLPKAASSKDSDKHKFWNWFWKNPESRGAATHSLTQRTTPLDLRDHRKLHLKEGIGNVGGFMKTARNRGMHFGMNVALGGEGNTNPWSGNTIAADGQHGHLYILYYEPTKTEPGGLLVGCEGSAPTDRMAKGIKHGMDQSGNVHDWRAKSSPFSPTGGPKFGAATKEKNTGPVIPKGQKKITVYWHTCGPTTSTNGTVVDLSMGWNQNDSGTTKMFSITTPRPTTARPWMRL